MIYTQRQTRTPSALQRGESCSDATSSVTDRNSDWFWQVVFVCPTTSEHKVFVEEGVILLKITNLNVINVPAATCTLAHFTIAVGLWIGHFFFSCFGAISMDFLPE